MAKSVRVEFTPTLHSDPSAVGFRMFTSNGVVSYTGDTELTSEVISSHQGSRIIIVNLTRPLKARVPRHMCTEDAAVLIKEAAPEMAVVTHFGMRLIREGVRIQTNYIEEHSGIRTIGAEDLMSLSIGKTVRGRRPDTARRDRVSQSEPFDI